MSKATRTLLPPQIIRARPSDEKIHTIPPKTTAPNASTPEQLRRLQYRREVNGEIGATSADGPKQVRVLWETRVRALHSRSYILRDRAARQRLTIGSSYQ